MRRPSSANVSRNPGPPAAYAPRPAAVLTREGSPSEVDGEQVAEEVETWLVEDRWWTEEPLRRRYWELVTSAGRRVVIFHDIQARGWFTQVV